MKSRTFILLALVLFWGCASKYKRVALLDEPHPIKVTNGLQTIIWVGNKESRCQKVWPGNYEMVKSGYVYVKVPLVRHNGATKIYCLKLMLRQDATLTEAMLIEKVSAPLHLSLAGSNYVKVFLAGRELCRLAPGQQQTFYFSPGEVMIDVKYYSKSDYQRYLYGRNYNLTVKRGTNFLQINP